MGHFREKKWAVMPTEAESDPAVFDTAYGGICSERFENLSNHDFFFKIRYNGTTASKAFPGSGTFTRGVHPPQRKDLAHDAPIEIIPP